jgi:Saxitoxin biosynthesis operon protein SxtJ
MKIRFNQKENIDSGLALVLILILSGLIWKHNLTIKIAVFCVLIIMIKPSLIYPFTFIWLNISDLLGKIMSRAILTVVFIFVLVPVGFVRKISGKDNLKLNQFKKSDKSVFINRDHTFTSEDMMNPY